MVGYANGFERSENQGDILDSTHDNGCWVSELFSSGSSYWQCALHFSGTYWVRRHI